MMLKRLQDHHKRVLRLYVTCGRSKTQAAKMAGISPRNMFRILEHPDARRYLDEMHERLDNAVVFGILPSIPRLDLSLGGRKNRRKR